MTALSTREAIGISYRVQFGAAFLFETTSSSLIGSGFEMVAFRQRGAAFAKQPRLSRWSFDRGLQFLALLGSRANRARGHDLRLLPA